MMRKSDIKTIKKAQQTVYFFNTLQHTPSAIFIQLTSNTQEQFLKLAAAVKKLDFFILTSLVKDHDTPNLFKCVTMIASNKSKTWTEVETCIKTVKLFYPTAIFFLVKDRTQFVPLDEVHALGKFENQSYLTTNVQSLMAPFFHSLLVTPQQSSLDLLGWLDNR